MRKVAPVSVYMTVLSVVFAGLFWFGVLPEVRALGRAQYQLDALQKASGPISSETITSKEAVLREQRDRAALLMPDRADQFELSVQVEGLMRQLLLPIQGLNVSAENVADRPGAPSTTTAQTQSAAYSPNLKKVTVSLDTTGAYAQVQRLVNSLTAMSRFITVDQVALTADAAEEGGEGEAAAVDPEQVSVSITAIAYYLDTAPAASAASEAAEEEPVE